MRFSVDTGGTFTDLLVEQPDGELRMAKALTTPEDPIEGVLHSIDLVARDLELSRSELLSRGELFIHGTTHAINAIITGNTAKTAFLTTEGHPDILVLREGGRSDIFNFTVPYPEPYVPKALTFEVAERITADGAVRRPLDEAAVLEIIDALRRHQVEAVAVCLLWSIVNPTHEMRVGELLSKRLPGVPVTLSHRLNTSLREYRRASSTCIDASLKPLMSAYMRRLAGRLRAEGFIGRILAVTSQAGVVDAEWVAEAPIHLINSGPAMAPVAGWRHATGDSDLETAIVADTGGTTFDVSLVRRGRIPRTRETWIGPPFRGHMTGLPSVDVKSIGAGGGSIAWVDQVGLLHVGPQSAGAVPGPVCYTRGGTQVTVTDAALVLGYLDPGFFLGGAIRLDPARAEAAIGEQVAEPLGCLPREAAAAVVTVATENMVQAILDITVNQGVDPRRAVLIGGGGAAGLNAVVIGRRLGCGCVIMPEVGAALSAAGALMSDLTAEHRAIFHTSTARFDRDGVNRVLGELEDRCRTFSRGPGAGAFETRIEFFAEARYPDQVWEIEVPLRVRRFRSEADIDAFVEDFHRTHQELFAVADPASSIEVVGWHAQVSCRLREGGLPRLAAPAQEFVTESPRRAYFPEIGPVDVPVVRFETMADGRRLQGPAIVESRFTTVVLDPEASCERRPSGSLVINPISSRVSSHE
jgi:N-methylhydantoinase A